MKILSTEELKKQMDAGPLAVFDVRGDVDYEKGHIPGTKTAPMGSLVFRVARVMNPNSKIVIYSHDENCPMATEAIERLTNLKMTNVHYYQDGVKGWKKAGHSLARSDKAREHTWGPVTECRPLIVDRENAYGGAFKGKPSSVESAGG